MITATASLTVGCPPGHFAVVFQISFWQCSRKRGPRPLKGALMTQELLSGLNGYDIPCRHTIQAASPWSASSPTASAAARTAPPPQLLAGELPRHGIGTLALDLPAHGDKPGGRGRSEHPPLPGRPGPGRGPGPGAGPWGPGGLFLLQLRGLPESDLPVHRPTGGRGPSCAARRWRCPCFSIPPRRSRRRSWRGRASSCWTRATSAL